ncbi:MAG: hypothetical protein U1C53_02640, partial [Candidatus Veblenbacteria bacterium]|nr:hypothetical protein [Candidatus Veblenbacteria bacterium]
MVFASHSHPLRSRGVVLIIVVMGMIGWWVATSSSQVEDLPVAVPTPTASVWLSCSTLLPSHQPVRLRLGTIAAVESGELTLRTAPLPGETGDALRVELTANTPVVEVRVPSYLGVGRLEVLEEGGQVIE